MESSHSHTIEMSITKEIITNSTRSELVKRITADVLARVSQFQFEAYIDNIFELGMDSEEAEKMRNRNYSAYPRRIIPPKISECVRKDPMEVLEVKFYVQTLHRTSFRESE